MRARLFSAASDMKVDHTFEIEAVLGRSSRSTVELRSKVLSARHARIAWNRERGCYMLEDLGSSNGTRLDGEPVREPRALGHLHVITLAEHHDLVFQDLERCAARHRAAEAGGPPTTRTAIEVLNLPLPGLPEADRTPEREKTLLQKLNLPLPGLLRGRSGETSNSPEARASEAGFVLPKSSAAEPLTQVGGDPAIPPTPSIPGAAPSTPSSELDETSPGEIPSAEAEGSSEPEVRLRDTYKLPGGLRTKGNKGGAAVDSGPVEVVTKSEPPGSTRPARWSLEMLDPGVSVPRFRLFDGDNVVGRKTGADIVIRSPEISRRHACLRVREGRLYVRDLGSRNRTFVDDVPVPVEGEGEVELSPGQKLRFGALETRVVVGGFSDEGRSLESTG